VAIRQWIEVLAAQSELLHLHLQIKSEFPDVFSEIPHTDELPTNVYCQIQLKDASKSVQTCTYSTPCKYCKAWAMLIQQHLDAGHIFHISPASLSQIQPCGLTMLGKWLPGINTNTPLDAHPLLCVDDILADCAREKFGASSIWQTPSLKPKYTWQCPSYCCYYPLWLVWMACHAHGTLQPTAHSPMMHDCCLRGKICHILDNIVIWLNSI